MTDSETSSGSQAGDWKVWFDEINDGIEAKNLLLYTGLKDTNSSSNYENKIKLNSDDWSKILTYLNDYNTKTGIDFLGSKYIKVNVIKHENRVIHIFVEKNIVADDENNSSQNLTSESYGLPKEKKGMVAIFLEDSEFVFIGGYLENDKKFEAIDYLTKNV